MKRRVLLLSICFFFLFSCQIFEPFRPIRNKPSLLGVSHSYNLTKSGLENCRVGETGTFSCSTRRHFLLPFLIGYEINLNDPEIYQDCVDEVSSIVPGMIAMLDPEIEEEFGFVIPFIYLNKSLKIKGKPVIGR